MSAVVVSDHALIRYLDRVLGLDTEFFRDQVAALVEPAVAQRARCARIAGHWYMLSGTHVTTVLPDGGRPHSKDRKRSWRSPDDGPDDELDELTDHQRSSIESAE